MRNTGNFLVCPTLPPTLLLMVHRLNLIVELFFLLFHLLLESSKMYFDMESRKSCFLSEGAEDRKVNKMKCTLSASRQKMKGCVLRYISVCLFHCNCKARVFF